ncbi:M48 family metallopeptidase [Kordiimonas marina]|uniref:M48 family metallopeptidase n=1 Tax=Kordiimonas marina TaxID=2872312 RepID=UPI001FF1143F|nr:M48 family metallopeptidase [Kordiimonas marina]MCJ9430708.1 M48 family metallopeptidase [Kordiimonas marina]
MRKAMAAAAAFLVLAGMALVLGHPAWAQTAADAAAGTGAHFDPKDATEAYLATVSGTARAQSDAYFEGGYWLILWDTVYSLGVAWLLLRKGFSARVRDWCERRSRRRFLQTFLFAAIYVLLSSLITLPWMVYTGFIREHQYGLANQSFLGWLADKAIGMGISVVALGLFIAVIYALVRKTGARWWLWGTGITAAFFAVVILISPVFIAPLFNDYEPLKDQKVEQAILTMAREQGAVFDHVYVYNESKQSDRITANVSGLFGTKRISLADNLLKRGTLPEIKAVVGHELGHYMLGHVYWLILELSAVLGAGYLFITLAYPRVVARWGQGWGLRGLDDMANLPLMFALLSVYMMVMTPVTNSITRHEEAAADAYGLNAAREPDGFATITLKLAQYRKLAPGPIEEMIFYDHPSAKSRIRMAMDWKAAHIKGGAAQ